MYVRRKWLSCALVGGVLLLPALARADPSARLSYVRRSGAESCPSEQAVRSAVGARLGYDPFLPSAADTLEVEVAPQKDGFVARVKLVDEARRERGAREIAVPGADCTPLVDAIALTISLTIDPESGFRKGPPPSRDRSTGGGSSPLPEKVPRRDASASAKLGSPSAHAGIGALGSFGIAPSSTLGAVLSLGLDWRYFSFDLEGRVDLPATGPSDHPPAAVRASLVAASLVPCGKSGALFACAVVTGGELRATGENISMPRDASAFWLGMGPRAGIQGELSHSFGIHGYVELLHSFTRHTLAVGGAPVYTLPSWSGGLGIAVVGSFR